MDGNQPTLFARQTSPDLPPLCSVALEAGIDRALTYTVPRGLAGKLLRGQRVRVPLGRSNRPAYGYVLEYPQPPPEGLRPEKLKPVAGIDDPRVLVTPPLLELARWISRYYFCPLGLTLDSIIPSAVKKRIGLAYITVARVLATPDVLRELLDAARQPKRRALYARLLDLPPGGELELTRLAHDAGVTIATARKLAAKGLIALHEVPDHASLEIGNRDPPDRSRSHPPPPPSPPSPAAAPPAQPGPPDPRPTPDTPPGPEPSEGPELVLTDDQRRALDLLAPLLTDGFHNRLLMGVTGSGKTEIYLRLARQVVDSGRQAIILVPEIALTPQTIARFSARFARVAYLHSGLSAGDRHRQWHTILSGKADVVVGARSAIFAPLPRLGLIVVDEEHDSAYKQETAPRYHARDLAIKRAQLEACLCLLSSATPSLESWHRLSATDAAAPLRVALPPNHVALPPTQATLPPTQAAPSPTQGALPPTQAALPPTQGALPPTQAAAPPRVALLPSRVRGLALPAVELIDMKSVLRRSGGLRLFSPRLEHALRETVSAGKQAILLLNRRGYSGFVYCNRCADPLKCRFCDTSLTYHRHAGALGSPAESVAAAATGALRCHYCLAASPHPAHCPVCSARLSLLGFGTQRMEEELTRLLPGASFARADSDSLRSASDYETLLGRFGRGEISILAGTQMIAKGLDFPNVTLVGVVSADTALALPDFRSAERTFQLITQVAGRAGRGDAPGRVIIQSFQPQDPAIQAALSQDFPAFARTELELRRQISLPPFSRLARLVFRDQSEPRAAGLAEEAAEALRATASETGLAVEVQGPHPCPLRRIAGYHRCELRLSAEKAMDIQRLLASVRQAGLLTRGDRLAIDIDPVSLL